MCEVGKGEWNRNVKGRQGYETAYLGMVIDSYLFGLVGPTAKQGLAL
jgi:hypothetical protein